MWDELKKLEPELKINTTSKNWRIGAKYYRSSPCQSIKAGTTSVSPAWFEQGHDVSNLVGECKYIVTEKKTDKYPLKVSKPLVPSDSPARRWLAAMLESSALIGGILSLVQPQLYEAGCNALLHLSQNPDEVDRPDTLLEVLQLWTAPFHGLSVISNRVTPIHRDSYGGKEWMDILVALGSYREGRLDLPTLGMWFRYDPGTIVALAGRVIAHSAECDGDRACIAYYMREKVHKRIGLPTPGWYAPGEK